MKRFFSKSSYLTAASALLVGAVLLSACQTADMLSSAAQEPGGRKVPVGPLKPHKDRLFAYRSPLEIRDDGNWLRVPYDELQDINKRDEVPVRKVRASYISVLPVTALSEFSYIQGTRPLVTHAAGSTDGSARFTVIYIHGRDGNRNWGFDDERFGGNFNRLKNLILAANGIYLSPDFTDFESAGTQDIEALIANSVTGSGPLIIACGSLGTKLCWSLARKEGGRDRLKGLVILGGFPDRNFLRQAYSGISKPLPVYIAHGSRDPVFGIEDMDDFYNALSAKNQPVRMTVFDTGNHGTPVRMIDWRGALNWILSK